MRNQNTVFVVGAGASREVGLPVGSELANLIADRLNYRFKSGVFDSSLGDPDILDVFQQDESTRDGILEYFEAAQSVRRGIVFSKSIDSFLDVHRSDKKIQRCGKLAIAKTILEQEGQSALAVEKGEFRDSKAVTASWLVSLAKGLFDGVRREDIGRVFEKISFVVFNYDRCVEHFLFEAVQRHYRLSPDETATILKTLRIFHPYGTIGNLNWQGDEAIPFGFKANRANLQLMERRIKTYTERVEERELLHSIRHQIVTADTLVFLGSSFHPENMKILSAGTDTRVEKIFGTACGISDSDLSSIKNDVGSLLKKLDLSSAVLTKSRPVYLRQDLRCSEILQYYSRALFRSGNGDD